MPEWPDQSRCQTGPGRHRWEDIHVNQALTPPTGGEADRPREPSAATLAAHGHLMGLKRPMQALYVAAPLAALVQRVSPSAATGLILICLVLHLAIVLRLWKAGWLIDEEGYLYAGGYLAGGVMLGLSGSILVSVLLPIGAFFWLKHGIGQRFRAETAGSSAL